MKSILFTFAAALFLLAPIDGVKAQTPEKIAVGYCYSGDDGDRSESGTAILYADRDEADFNSATNIWVSVDNDVQRVSSISGTNGVQGLYDSSRYLLEIPASDYNWRHEIRVWKIKLNDKKTNRELECEVRHVKHPSLGCC